MKGDFRKFLHAVFGKWGSGMCGGFGLLFTVVGLSLAVASLSVESLKSAPVLTAATAIAFCLIGVACLLYAVFDTWREKNKEADAALKRLEPKLEILEEAEIDPVRRCCRIRVRNKSGFLCRFGAEIVGIAPAGALTVLPFVLRLTSIAEAGPSWISGSTDRLDTLPAGGTRTVDVMMRDGTGSLCFLGPADNECRVRYDAIVETVTIHAFSDQEGVAVERKFLVFLEQIPRLCALPVAVPPDAPGTAPERLPMPRFLERLSCWSDGFRRVATAAWEAMRKEKERCRKP
ncbi:MAG TPA: hypothetical protein VFW33_06245 [Gemmataceae bacterium]|nr:hypothetical protein [Gemmataceae bacterium]